MFARLTRAALLSAVLIPSQVFAQADSEKIDVLFAAMGMDDMLAIMQSEGIEYGAQIADDLFPGRATTEWTVKVENIYALDSMTQIVRTGLEEALADADVDGVIAFFESDLGQTIVDLEVSARKALMDDDLEDASKAAAAIALADETPRAALVTTFVETNDLLETNVVGAMNANYAFYMGLVDGGGLTQGMSQDEILADVWSQEPEIRQNTAEWIYAYLLLAYQPLSDEELQSYIAFSQSEAGQDINTALFIAFDGMFEGISGELGFAASAFMVGQEL